MFPKKDLNSLKNIISKIKNPERGIEQEVFDILCKIITHVACELIILNQHKEILLTYRHDKIWQGWHFPGGILRYREAFESRLKQVAKLELQAKLKTAKFLFPFNYINGQRGHDVSLVFLCELKSKPKIGKWFKQMPKNIISEHKELWKKVKYVV
jgi:colanic acid biosynthesis protein WcaH